MAAQQGQVQAAGERSHEPRVDTEKDARLGIDNSAVAVRLAPVGSDYKKLAAEMETERPPTEFIETITTGWWTVCLEVLSHKRTRPRPVLKRLLPAG